MVVLVLVLSRLVSCLFFSFLFFSFLLAGNEIHLYVVPATNLLILFCVRIEVRRAKRSQFDAVRTMLGRCVARKAVVQSFHPRDNTPSVRGLPRAGQIGVSFN